MPGLVVTYIEMQLCKGNSDLITYAKAIFSLDEKCFFSTEDLATVDALAIFVEMP